MRSISAQKIISFLMGIVGIFIILLSIDSADFLIPGMKGILLNNPILGGLLSGLPLLTLRHSSKQYFQMDLFDRVDHSSFSGTAALISTSYEVPLDAWLHKTKTVAFQDTAFDNDFALAVAWTGDSEAIVWDQGTDNENRLENIVEQWDADSVHEFQHSYPVHLFYVNNAVDDNDKGTTIIETKLGGPGKYVEAGQQIYCHTTYADITTAPSAGVLNLVTTATFIVVCHQGKTPRQRPEELAPWVTIVGESPSSNDSMFAWPANTNMRIANLRVAIYGGVNITSQFHFTVDKLAPDMNLSEGSIELHKTAFLSLRYPILDSDAAGQVNTTALTAYARGPHYLKKGESLQFRHEAVSTYYSVQFQYIPDFGHTVEFKRRFENTSYTADFTNQWIALFTVPYDMFITVVKGNVAIITDNNESDAYWTLDLMGLKSKNMIDNTDMLLSYANANVDGNILGASNAAGSLPWSLATLGITVETVDTSTTTETVDNTTTAIKTPYTEAIADFYPAGSQLGFWFPDDASSNISQLFIEMHVEALNRIKTADVGSHVLDGYHVVRQEAF